MKCYGCGKYVSQEDSVWIDPVSTLATSMGEPYHVECGPGQKTPVCLACGGLIENYDDLWWSDGYAWHQDCRPEMPT